MRIAIDYTPAIRQRAGIGRYTRGLVNALIEMDAENEYVLLVVGKVREARGNTEHATRNTKPGRHPASLPPNFRLRRLPLPHRLVTIAWHRLHLPLPAELFVGPVDIFHSPDFVLPPLRAQASRTLAEFARRGAEVQVVEPAIEDRFYCYILGRGVPPPKPDFRWCTEKLKLAPMMRELRLRSNEYGAKVLQILGVRRGESVMRDQHIVARDGAVLVPPAGSEPCATLTPILHWNVHQVWEWLERRAPQYGFSTVALSNIYGGDGGRRTGCIACPLASRDVVLERVVRMVEWSHLAPLLELRPLLWEMRQAQYRLRQPGTQRLKDGRVPKNPMRMGPLHVEARRYFLERVLDIQRRADFTLISVEEESFIRGCWERNVWPDGWSGEEPGAALLLPQVLAGGAVQLVLAGWGEEVV